MKHVDANIAYFRLLLKSSSGQQILFALQTKPPEIFSGGFSFHALPEGGALANHSAF
jgi:hypothetical protein